MRRKKKEKKGNKQRKRNPLRAEAPEKTPVSIAQKQHTSNCARIFSCLSNPTIRMLFLEDPRNWNCGKVENFGSHTLILLD